MKKILYCLIFVFVFICPIDSFACFMDDVQQKIFEQKIISLPAHVRHIIIIQVNDLRVALVVNGMNDEQIEKITNYIAELKDPTVIIDNQKFYDGIVTAQQIANENGIGSLQVLGMANKGTGVQTILQGQVGNAVQTIKLNTGKQQPEYNTTTAVITNNNVQTVANNINQIHNINTTPYITATPQIDTATNKTVVLPRKRRISTNGAGGVIITNSIIKNK